MRFISLSVCTAVIGAFSPGLKWPGRETDHSPPSTAEVEDTWSYTSTAPVLLHVVVSTNGCLHGVVLR